MKIRLVALTALMLWALVPATASAFLPEAATITENRNANVNSFSVSPGLELLNAPTPTSLDAASRAFLSTQRSLFGTHPELLQLRAIYTHHDEDGHAFVIYDQVVNGLPVIDGFIQLHYSGGTLLQVATGGAPPVDSLAAFELDATQAEQHAASAVTHRDASISDVTERAVFNGRPVYVVMVETRAPRGLFETIVDAVDGTVLRRRDKIYYADVRLIGEVEPRQVGDARELVALIQTNGGQTTDDDGLADIAGTSFDAVLSGPHARINDQAAAEASKSFTLATGGAVQELQWLSNEAPIEQLDAWHYINKVIARSRFITPGFAWHNNQLPVNININDTCNAFYNGNSINFFQAGGGCNNTARMLDVVAHEWGHGFHDNRSSQGINAPEIQEGVADYLAYTLTNDPEMSPQFFQGGGGIRNVEPDRVYPDDMTGQVHNDGLVWGGSWWDLRKEMIAKYGYDKGVYLTDRLHSRTLRGGPRIESAYEDALATDDDDNNVGNGTPNSCEINRAFEPHGLIINQRRPESGYVTFDHSPVPTPQTANAEISIEVNAQAPSTCGGLDASSVTLHYTIDGTTFTDVPLSQSGGLFSGSIPAMKDGTFVQYYFSARTDDAIASLWTSPAGAPRTLNGFSVGSYGDVVRWDFESGGSGFTLAADWEVGDPRGKGWDPSAAFEGSGAAGTDLGVAYGDGMYRNGATSALAAPAVDCSKCKNARLQFRRWVNTAPDDIVRVRVNDTIVWEDTDGDLHDGMWMYQEIDIASVADGNGTLAIEFELAADANGMWGGWTLDDIAVVSAAVGPDGGGETDPDGNGAVFTLDGGCQCALQPTRQPPTTALGLLAVLAIGAALLRRRRRE